MTTQPQSVPFTIDISADRIQLLRQKLALTTLPDELEDSGRDYGVPLSDIQRLLARWKDGYDWKKYEKQMNAEFFQFKVPLTVEGHGTLNIHYIHKQSPVAGAIPLLFVHGWPGNFLEVRKILPQLTEANPNHPSFHVVAFSLPGYGFSDAPKKKGFAVSQMAEVGHKLMLHLGYDEYVTQGGDWGHAITKRIASLYGGRHSKAWHSNFGKPLPQNAPPTLSGSPLLYLRNMFNKYTPAEKSGLERTKWFVDKGRGYNQEQSTQPQTLGYSLADSPIGLLAWIYEKLVNWSDEYPWDDDEVLTWVSIYWFSTGGPTSSIRLYYEATNDLTSVREPTIPHGMSFFPKELYNYPRLWTRTKYRIFEAEHERGGHFAAHERPDDIVADLRKMFGQGGPAYGVVKGKTGY